VYPDPSTGPPNCGWAGRPRNGASAAPRGRYPLPIHFCEQFVDGRDGAASAAQNLPDWADIAEHLRTSALCPTPRPPGAGIAAGAGARAAALYRLGRTEHRVRAAPPAGGDRVPGADALDDRLFCDGDYQHVCQRLGLAGRCAGLRTIRADGDADSNADRTAAADGHAPAADAA